MKNFKSLLGKNIYFVGIGGVSMSGLAMLAQSLGANVSGSDMQSGSETNRLESLGIKVYLGHKDTHVTKDIDLVIYTGAIKSDNPEIQQARKLKIKAIERSQFLGGISKFFDCVIAVAGTHGKTTTTAMLGEILLESDYNPTIHLGGESVNMGVNTYLGAFDYLVLEACEYRESFLSLRPDVAVITNIESDHLDYYRDYSDVFNSFSKFAKKSKHLVIDRYYDIKHRSVTLIDKNFAIKKTTFKDGGYNFSVYKNNSYFASFRLNMLGDYNVENALFAIAVADYLSINKLTIRRALEKFRGVKRRNECIGHIGQVPIIIDYAHHPTEIKNFLQGLKREFNNTLVIFQPHTFSRTKSLFGEFVEVLKKVDNLILYETYPAREEEIVGGRAEDLAAVLDVECVNNIDKLEDIILDATISLQIDSCVILGAGDLANRLQSHLNTQKSRNKLI